MKEDLFVKTNTYLIVRFLTTHMVQPEELREFQQNGNVYRTLVLHLENFNTMEGYLDSESFLNNLTDAGWISSRKYFFWRVLRTSKTLAAKVHSIPVPMVHWKASEAVEDLPSYGTWDGTRLKFGSTRTLTASVPTVNGLEIHLYKDWTMAIDIPNVKQLQEDNLLSDEELIPFILVKFYRNYISTIPKTWWDRVKIFFT